MGYWDDLRASGINLYERYCIKCQTKKSISFFPKHQKYKKSNTCFQCLDEIECTNCGKVKKYDAFKAKHSGTRKSKTECWECFVKRTNDRKKKNYAKRKMEGTLPSIDRTNMPMHSLIWGKISSKKSNSNKKDNERSSVVEMSSDEFKIWFNKNYDETCYYCGVSIEEFRASKFLKEIRPQIKNFGVDRKDTKQGYTLSNIAICCNLCNSVKGSFFNNEEFKEIGKKYIRKLYD